MLAIRKLVSMDGLTRFDVISDHESYPEYRSVYSVAPLARIATDDDALTRVEYRKYELWNREWDRERGCFIYIYKEKPNGK